MTAVGRYTDREGDRARSVRSGVPRALEGPRRRREAAHRPESGSRRGLHGRDQDHVYEISSSRSLSLSLYLFLGG
jgi:hypothetical protein